MTMELRKASRQKAKLRIGLAGPSGSGKTYSALKLAYGLCGDWSKIAIIDTENKSADLYCHLGDYQVLELEAPYHPRRYIEAINTCENAGIEVLIIDSITHEWSGKGGCLELHDQETNKMRQPNSYVAWGKITPLHDAFIQSILQSTIHVITTVRSKTDYIQTERNGRKVIEKAGMGQVTRDGFEYELTVSFDLDQGHQAFASKDRTGMFMDKPPIVMDEQVGRQLLDWAGQEEKADKKQVEQIKALLKRLSSDGKKTLEFYSIKKWSQLSFVKAGQCIALLQKKVDSFPIANDVVTTTPKEVAETAASKKTVKKKAVVKPDLTKEEKAEVDSNQAVVTATGEIAH